MLRNLGVECSLLAYLKYTVLEVAAIISLLCINWAEG